VRGVYRLAYDPAFYNIYLNISSAAPNVLLNTLTGASATGNPLPADPLGPAVREELQPFLLTGIFDPRRFNETNITPDFGPQRVHSWSLGVQRDLGGTAVFEVRYVGNHATRLFQTVNGNPYIAGLAALYPSLVPAGLTPCSAADAQVTAAIGRANCDAGVERTRTNTGYSDYNGLQTELRSTQLWRQLALKTNYTFSKTTDNVSEIFGTGAAGGTTAFAQSAREVRGPTPYFAVENEPAPRLIVDPVLPGPLALGLVQIQYRVENVRILPVFGEAALKVSPRVGHLHITVDDLHWWWADASDNNTVDIAGLPPGQHKVKIELVDANHNVFPGQVVTLTFTVPGPTK